jgi:hypothetical protein
MPPAGQMIARDAQKRPKLELLFAHGFNPPASAYLSNAGRHGVLVTTRHHREISCHAPG